MSDELKGRYEILSGKYKKLKQMCYQQSVKSLIDIEEILEALPKEHNNEKYVVTARNMKWGFEYFKGSVEEL